MKYLNIKPIFFVLILLWISNSCTDEDKMLRPDEVMGGAFATEVSSTGDLTINKNDPASSFFEKTYTIDSPEDGANVQSISLYASFDGLSTSVDEVLYTTVNAAQFTSNGELPEVTLAVDGEELLDKLGLTKDDLEGGDAFSFRLELTTPEGTFSTVSANFDNQSADHTYTAQVVCILPHPPYGDWRVHMEDLFGDGWQTDSANGGSGITITFNTGEVIEVGLCTPYEPNDYACTGDYESGDAIVTIPEGVTSAVWYFPGDFYGEIKFDIYAPSGNLVASYGAGLSAGIITLNLCNE